MTLSEIKLEKKFWQRALRLAGYYTGSIDGIKGPKQTAAEKQWDDAVAEGKSKYGTFDERTERNLETLLPVVQNYARKWLKEKAMPWAAENGLVLKLIQGTRSYGEQDALYAQGRTKKGAKVTNARGGYSNHNFCIAFDIGLFKGGSYLESDTQYVKLHKACGHPEQFEWGGNWTSPVDTPHYQYAKWGKTTSAIRAIF